ncbi:fumarylacetoacetate hydrolase FahA [Massarina eburnea CBS 473.64]|uniref:Fumarylacetoacetase n=1 Tax=Massarina eburnea CBS 473.64 TaxID=1395130 RepID=A0A6A6S049_9PLEO|nr:fumarylacetoacetate hydrolase FahA [Massarina eburnea CBS 473.64]
MSPLKSWFNIPHGSHFSLANIPFGIISTASSTSPRVAVAVGDHALDLDAFAANNGFSALSTIQPHQAVFSQPSLNSFAALGRPVHSVVRKYIQSVFAEDTPYPEVLKTNSALQKQALLPLKEVKYHLPFKIGDYTDFFAGYHHAYHCGVMFRGPEDALQPNYKHLPVGYHGRASSVVVSGTPIHRPQGQFLENPADGKKVPIFSQCRKLDFELELGAFVCTPNEQGKPVSIDEAENNLFGIVMMNDWSARDIQAWEYVPLGPFNAKNFGTSISPWVVLIEALEPFKVAGIENDAETLPYLKHKSKENVFDIQLQVDLKTSAGNSATLAKTSGRNLMWSFSQMLTHHSITGCNLQPGDLLGSGTISGTVMAERGSMLEQSDNGKNSVKIADEERKFLQDGDEVTFTGVCGADDDALVGFGQCTGRILPAVDLGL